MQPVAADRERRHGARRNGVEGGIGGRVAFGVSVDVGHGGQRLDVKRVVEHAASHRRGVGTQLRGEPGVAEHGLDGVGVRVRQRYVARIAAHVDVGSERGEHRIGRAAGSASELQLRQRCQRQAMARRCVVGERGGGDVARHDGADIGLAEAETPRDGAAHRGVAGSTAVAEHPHGQLGERRDHRDGAVGAGRVGVAAQPRRCHRPARGNVDVAAAAAVDQASRATGSDARERGQARGVRGGGARERLAGGVCQRAGGPSNRRPGADLNLHGPAAARGLRCLVVIGAPGKPGRGQDNSYCGTYPICLDLFHRHFFLRSRVGWSSQKIVALIDHTPICRNGRAASDDSLHMPNVNPRNAGSFQRFSRAFTIAFFIKTQV